MTNRATQQPLAPHGRRRARRLDAAFTLVELMIVTAILGLLASVAMPVFSKYTRRTRTVEATNIVAKIITGALSYYMVSRNNSAGATVWNQFPGTAGVSVESPCCGFTAGKCPGNPFVYSLSPWKDLNFEIADPHVFVPVALNLFVPGTTPTGYYWAYAQGDLDCDGVYSMYQARINAPLAGQEIPQQTVISAINDLE